MAFLLSRKKLKIISTFFQKPLDKTIPLCYNIVVPLMNVINNCWCGSMAEHLICNQAVDGSTPFTSSIFGGFPERPKGADCKSVVTDFGGPNPPSPTRKKPSLTTWLFSMKRAWRMNHEAGLRPMKCAVGTWRRGARFTSCSACGTLHGNSNLLRLPLHFA